MRHEGNAGMPGDVDCAVAGARFFFFSRSVVRVHQGAQRSHDGLPQQEYLAPPFTMHLSLWW